MYILVLHVIDTLLLFIPFEVISQWLQHPPLPLDHHVSFEPHDVLDDLVLQVLGEDGGERHVGHGAGEEADLGLGDEQEHEDGHGDGGEQNVKCHGLRERRKGKFFNGG